LNHINFKSIKSNQIQIKFKFKSNSNHKSDSWNYDSNHKSGSWNYDHSLFLTLSPAPATMDTASSTARHGAPDAPQKKRARTVRDLDRRVLDHGLKLVALMEEKGMVVRRRCGGCRWVSLCVCRHEPPPHSLERLRSQVHAPSRRASMGRW
jgi:hypothetical protein